MEEVRRSLEEAGIDPDNVNGWQDLEGFDAEELRQALQEARDEMKTALGPSCRPRSARQWLRLALKSLRTARRSPPPSAKAMTAWRSLARLWLRPAPRLMRPALAATSTRQRLDGAKFDFDRDVMRSLREAGINIDFAGKRFSGPHNDLYEAADDCNVEEVNKLIAEKKVDINAVVPGRRHGADGGG